MILPTNYTALSPMARREAREEYVRLQGGKCHHCGRPLDERPSDEVASAWINRQLFPPNFFKFPIHLHHDHKTGMTIGAIHSRCNAYLWQYRGE